MDAQADWEHLDDPLCAQLAHTGGRHLAVATYENSNEVGRRKIGRGLVGGGGWMNRSPSRLQKCYINRVEVLLDEASTRSSPHS